MANPAPPTIGLVFSGCGSAAAGAQQAGYSVKYFCDPRKFAPIEQTWELNYPRALRSQSLKDFRDVPVDLIIGSPPCASYSLLNRTKSKLDLYAQSPDTVEYTAFLREINARQPKAWVLENLPRLRTFLFFSLNPTDPVFYVNYYSRKKKLMKTVPVLTMPGYHIHQYVLDSSDFGIAQTRKRLFIIGMKTEFPFSWTPPTLKTKLWLNQAIRGIPNDAPNHTKVWLNGAEAKHWRKLKYNERTPETKSRKMAPKEPCSTIVGGSLQHYHYSEPRYLTGAECAIIQGFPSSFRFAGTNRQVLTQIGKSISVPIARSLSTYIKRVISISDQEKALDIIMGHK